MAKPVKNKGPRKAEAKPPKPKRAKPKKRTGRAKAADTASRPPPPLALGPAAAVLDRIYGVVLDRRDADPEVSHSARLLARGRTKVAQKFGEEAVECLIEAVAGNREALIAESADVLYHLIVLWVDAGVSPDEIWAELKRREGISGVAEKASRARTLPLAYGLSTTKIP
jgi:phosphoribosyl-ATP pyrophosphohydrolase